MASDRLSRHLLIAFILALLLYVVGYSVIEGRRTRHTPWQVAFRPETNTHSLLLTITQESLQIGPAQVRIHLRPDQALPAAETLSFGEVRPVPFPVPGGRCVFHDATFLPGSVALEIGGVPVQLLPRTLTVGTNELLWDQAALVETRSPFPAAVTDAAKP